MVSLGYSRFENSILDRFSNWLLRTTAYVLRFLEILKTKKKSIDELNSVDKVQQDALKKKKVPDSKSRCYFLSCTYSEEDGVIRLGGRLYRSSKLSLDTKRP